MPSVAMSDHEAVILVPVGGGTQAAAGHRIETTVRSNDRNSKSLLARHLADTNWWPLYKMTSTEAKTTYFYDVTTSLLNQYLPLRVTTRHSADKPWITDDFRHLIRQRQYAWTHHRTADYNRHRNAVNRLSRKLRKRYYAKQIEGLRSSDSANWWRRTKLLTGQDSRSGLVGLANSKTHGDMQELANHINESLIEVSADLTRLSAVDDVVGEYEASLGECDYFVSPDEVFHKLERINIRKSPGPDGLPNWFLRDFAFALCDPLCNIFNWSVQEGVVPSIWKQANVIAIPKTNPPHSIEQDLRPISLTATVSKIFESLVGRWMLHAIGDKFDQKQFGAIRGRSTSHALVDMMHTWHRAMDERKSARVLFVDYAKAFDHVDHHTVIGKLAVLGVPPILLRWLHSFLMNRQQRVKINDRFSDWASPNGGMPQGTWLGPYVFLSLINDLRSLLELHKFVDDCTLTEIISPLNVSVMQQELDKLNDWSDANHMNVNTRKTKEMLIGNIRANPPPTLQLHGHSIERVQSYKLLGLYVTDTLKWNEHVSRICSKAAQRLHFLKQLKRSAMSTDDLLYYYQSVVRPVTEYACVVWHTSLTKRQTKQLEAIQRRALKIIFGNDSDAVSDALSSLSSLSERRELLTKKFFVGLLSPSSCLHDIIPDKNDNSTISKLRHKKLYPPPKTRTEHFKNSTIIYALNNYQ